MNLPGKSRVDTNVQSLEMEPELLHSLDEPFDAQRRGRFCLRVHATQKLLKRCRTPVGARMHRSQACGKADQGAFRLAAAPSSSGSTRL